MEETNVPPARPAARNWGMRIYQVMSGFGLATTLLLLLGLLTWFATLEQVEQGLHPTLNKYFHWKAFWLLPELNGKVVPLPLPGGYWVSALLLVNMTLGGLVHIRKGWKRVGVMISHFGIIFMLVAGGVAHHASERGNMAVGEGEISNTAEDYFEYVVEVAEVDADGKSEKVHVIRGMYLTDLEGSARRLFRFPALPFDLEITGFFRNAVPVSATDRAPDKGQPVVDGYWLFEKPDEINAEANTAACHARVLPRDGPPGEPFLLAGASFHPFTVRIDDRLFTVDMRKRLWPMPFDVRLDEFTAEFHPGTSRPEVFVSEVTRLEEGGESKVTIEMNAPMRYEGLTFFQASYGPPGAMPGDKMYSVFEIVRNPADKWPEWSLYIVAFGLLVHFIQKLALHLGAGKRKRTP